MKLDVLESRLRNSTGHDAAHGMVVPLSFPASHFSCFTIGTIIYRVGHDLEQQIKTACTRHNDQQWRLSCYRSKQTEQV